VLGGPGAETKSGALVMKVRVHEEKKVRQGRNRSRPDLKKGDKALGGKKGTEKAQKWVLESMLKQIVQ